MLAFGMGGCLCYLVVMVILLGLVLPLRVLIIWLKLLLVVTLLAWFLVGIPPDGYDPATVSCIVPDSPNVWTDGSLILDKVAGISSSGVLDSLLIILPLFGMFVAGGTLIIFTLLVIFRFVEVSALSLDLFKLFKGLRCGVLFWLSNPLVLFILGVDNLGVVRHVDRMLRGCRCSKPFELVNDGDLLLLIERMLIRRGLDTVRVSKVKGHADDAMVLHGQVRRDDKLGNDAADEAADFGRRRVSPAVIDARRNLSWGLCSLVPCCSGSSSFFIAISRAVVNHDDLGGTAPDPLVWSAGALRKRRRLVHAVRDRAFFARSSWHLEFWLVSGSSSCCWC